MADEQTLRQLRGFIFDMDGVIYRGPAVLPGALEFVALLQERGIAYLFLTNNSTTPPTDVAARLRRMGIASSADEIVTSAEVTAAHLAAVMPNSRVLLLGEEGIRRALLAQGLRLALDHRDADAVVVGLDRHCTYAALQEAAFAVQRGAPLLATNTDRSLPTPAGLIPGAGALVAALETATGVRAQVFGKPSPEVYLYALPRLGVAPELTAVIGDRPETDILGGQRAGLRTIAVLTGVGTAEDFAAMTPPPDWVFPSLAELRQAYFG